MEEEGKARGLVREYAFPLGMILFILGGIVALVLWANYYFL